MPVITFEYSDLKEFGIEIENEKLIELLPQMGSDIEDFDDETVKVEFFPNRPDNLSVEGIARSFKGFIGQEIGLAEYEVKESNDKVFVDEEIKNIRPYISFALIKNVKINEKKLIKIFEFQEFLHWVIGRDRKKVAIGIHNVDTVNGPYRYIATKKDENSFIPLDYNEKMTPDEILKKHEKGVDYADLIDKFDRYPLILDKDDQVLSMPPIINGELTKLKAGTTNLLVDVTGTDEIAVNQTLNIICSSFGESGGKIESLEVVYPDRTVITPDLSPKIKNVNIERANRFIGLDLSPEEMVYLLKKARMDAKIVNDEITVKIPSYRIDILHEVDLIENIAIQYNINKINPVIPDVFTVAKEDSWFENDKFIREALIGLGFQEVMSLMLTNEDNHYTKMNQEIDERVEVAQPISQERTMIRKNLLNGLLEFFEFNKHEDLPQKIFEIGDVIYIDDSIETKGRTVKKLAGAITHSSANFTEIKSTVYSLVNNLGYDIEINSSKNKSFIEGRVADLTGTSKNGKINGVFGELSPDVIRAFDLYYPVIAFEIEFE